MFPFFRDFQPLLLRGGGNTCELLFFVGYHIGYDVLVGVPPHGSVMGVVSVVSALGGILIGRVTLPLVNEGEALFHLAKFQDPQAVGEQLEEYHESLIESDHLADSGAKAANGEMEGV